ncbi:hypothetical protein DFH27DRAFT_361999 [Peziza echinospora]|nr:hypothetical protein DFH27DRAFT_361999 [Peziza echinospora]
MATTYAQERKIALLAVKRAALLTDRIYNSQVKGTTLKEDKSPVTLADLGGQALVIAALRHAFPKDHIVGEEDSDILRSSAEKRDLLWSHVSHVLKSSDSELAQEIGTIKSAEEMMDLIDLGNHNGGRVGRIWALDPVDGTLGFLRGGQYAVALGLIVDGEVKVGAMACPNLPVDIKNPEGEKGVLLSAERGQGTTLTPASRDEPKKVRMNDIQNSSSASFVESVEAGHSSHNQQASIAKRLNITKPSVRMDSQAKYASIARGDGDIYLRLPTSRTYEEKIWDHAAGSIIVEEAGGQVSDSAGRPLDFGLGKTLKANKGVVAAMKDIFPEVIQAVVEELNMVKK